MSGVGISSAVFQSILDRELRKRIQTPDADQVSPRRCDQYVIPINLSVRTDNQRNSTFCAFGGKLAT